MSKNKISFDNTPLPPNQVMLDTLVRMAAADGKLRDALGKARTEYSGKLSELPAVFAAGMLFQDLGLKPTTNEELDAAVKGNSEALLKGVKELPNSTFAAIQTAFLLGIVLASQAYFELIGGSVIEAILGDGKDGKKPEVLFGTAPAKC